jgi:tetratricopeptide (TPR) repeat protein
MLARPWGVLRRLWAAPPSPPPLAPPAPAAAPPPAAESEAGLESLELVSDLDPLRPVFRPGEVVAARFRVVRFLARGSMGELYEADDLELRGRVALKTILPQIADEERLIRLFKREVHLARQVTHPNVCRMYDVFRHRMPAGEGGGPPAREVVFLAMELLHGETLTDRLKRGRLSTAEALPLARQMAAGLLAAHRVGVVHRDFKCQNVMLVAPAPEEPDVRVVITDFGLARRSADQAHQASVAMSQVVAMSGTPAYMSPEQVFGGTITASTDIYALGVVLYEMVTGTRPFQGDNPLQIALKRLKEDAPPPRVHVPDLDRRWDAAIMRCLARSPTDRFRDVGEVLTALEEGGAVVRPAPGRAGRRAGWAAAAAGLTILAVGIGAWVLRSGRTPRGEAAGTVVLADFSNATDDAAFDERLNQRLATGLRESSRFALLAEQTVHDTLRMMRRPAEERLTGEIAQEVCQRAGSRAVIEGSIASLGSQYVIGLHAVDCQTGDSVGRETSPAATKEDVPGALDQAATRLRGTVSEWIAALPPLDAPMAPATTASLEALKRYASGQRAASEEDALAAIPFFRQAIELDPKFAMAYVGLGNVYLDLREPELGRRNLETAHALRDDVSERERFALDTHYQADVTGDLLEAQRTCQRWASAHPGDAAPHVHLAAIHADQGRHQESLAATEAALRLGADDGAAAAALVASYRRLNRLHEAKAACERALARHGNRPGLHLARHGIAFLEGDAAEMQRQIAWGAGRPAVEDLLLSEQSDAEATSGRMQTARELSRRAVEAARRADKPEAAALAQLNAALWEVGFGHPEAARRQTAAALASRSTTSVRILAALVLARAGDSERARRMADELADENPVHLRINAYWLPAIRAAIELDRANPSKAISLLEAALPYELGVSDAHPGAGALHPAYLRGLAHLSLKQGTAAAAEFQKLVDHSGLVLHSSFAALARLGLARAHALGGDGASARNAYADLFALWKDADADLPVLREARAEQARPR